MNAYLLIFCYLHLIILLPIPCPAAQQVNSRSRTNSPKGYLKAQQSFNVSYTTLVTKSQHSTWTIHQSSSKLIVARTAANHPPSSHNMIRTRGSARLGNADLTQIEELRLKNAEINKAARMKKAAEEEEERKKTEEANKITDDVSDKAATITPRNLHNVMNGRDVTPNNEHEEDDDIAAIMEIDGVEAIENTVDTSELSPVKKRSKSKKRASSRPRVSPPEPKSNEDTTKTASFLEDVVYNHSRIILELAIALRSDKVFEEFTQALMAFITNAQMVDPKFVINPINPSSKEKNISNKGEVSSNMTKLGTHVKISGNGNVFNKKKVWNNQSSKRNSRNSQKEEFRDPVVYFLMIISTQVEPSELIDRLTHEWARINGTRLQVKDLQSISSETVVSFFKMSTATPKKVILAELIKILLETQKRIKEEAMNSNEFYDFTKYEFSLDDGVEFGETLPPMNLRVQNALLRGQEVTVFNRLSHIAQLARKSWHLEVDSRHAKKMKALIQCAKTYGCVEEMWGYHAHLSEVTDFSSTPREAKRQVDVAQAHTNYQLSMVVEELSGIVSLDEPQEIQDPETNKKIGVMTLRTVLMNYLKMEDGHPMIAEAHQEDICKPTYIIVPQTEEAERMVGMMNKNLPVFLYHMLLEIDFTEEIIKKLLKTSCDTSLVAQIPLCKWNSGSRSLTTPEEERKEKAVKPLESAAWFKDEFGLLKKGPKPRIPLPSNEQFNLDSTSSIKTIHDRHLPQPASILKNPTTQHTTATDAVDLSKNDDSDSSGDSASQTSSSSDEGDDDSSGDEGSRSNASVKDDEEMSATDSG